MKTCTECGETRDESEYYHRRGKRASRCKACTDRRTRAYRLANPDRIAEYDRRKRYKAVYGITPADYDRMFAAQGGVCALCGSAESRGRSERLLVDHCHETGRVRGLLCFPCNTALAVLGDGPQGLGRALAYVSSGIPAAPSGARGLRSAPVAARLADATTPAP